MKQTVLTKNLIDKHNNFKICGHKPMDQAIITIKIRK